MSVSSTPAAIVSGYRESIFGTTRFPAAGDIPVFEWVYTKAAASEPWKLTETEKRHFDAAGYLVQKIRNGYLSGTREVAFSDTLWYHYGPTGLLESESRSPGRSPGTRILYAFH